MQNAMMGAEYGLQNLAAGLQAGGNRMLSDLGSLMPRIASPQVNQMIQARHGMYAHEMTLGSSIGARFGRGVPETTTAYEYREMTKRDLGQRVGGAAVMGGLYGSAAAISWFGGGAALTKGFSYGRKAAKASAFGSAAIRFGAKHAGMGGARLALGAAGIAGGLAAAIPGVALFEGASAYIGAIAEDVQERQAAMNFIEASSFRYAQGTGEDFKKGGGFTRKAQSKIVDAIKQVDLGDSRFDMKDLKGILESGTELGLFNGVKDAEDFGKKFKELTGTLKKVTSTLHQSLAEGMKTIKDLKDSGFRTGSQISGAILTGDILGSASGKTAAEMLTMGRQGSEMVRGTGINMSAGANMMMENIANVRSMKNAGILDAETIAQAGGENTLAQQMMGSNINFLRSGLGKGVLAAISGPGGGLNAESLGRIAKGEVSMQDIASMGRNAMSDPKAFLESFANQGERLREVSQQYGDQGIEMLSMGIHIAGAKNIASMSGADMETALKTQMKMSGYSDPAIKAMIGKLQNVDQVRKERTRSFDIQSQKMSAEMVRNRTDLSGKMGDWFHGTFINKPSGAISGLKEEAGELLEGAITGVDNFIDKTVFGITKTKLISATHEERMKAIAGGGNFNISALDKDVVSSSFTEERRLSFEKTKSFSKIISEKSNLAFSEEASKAKSLDELTNTVFGFNYKNLNKEEKMFIASVTDRSGQSEIKEEILDRVKSSRKEIQDNVTKQLSSSKEERDAAREALLTVRTEALDKTFGAKANLDAGTRGGAIWAIGLIRKDKKAGEIFDSILIQKQKIEDLEEEEAKAKESGQPFSSKKSKELDEAVGARFKSLKNLGDLLEDKSPNHSESMKTALSKLMNSDLDMSEVTGKISSAKDVLKTKRRSELEKQIFLTADKNLVMAARAAGSTLKDDDDLAEYGTLISKLRVSTTEKGGESLTGGEFSSLRKLAIKAKQGSIADFAAFGAEVFKQESRTPEEARALLKEKGNLTFKEGELLGSWGEDGKASKQEILAVRMRAFGSSSGETVISGGDGGSDKVVKAEAKAIMDLQQVQSKTMNVLLLLDALASKLMTQKTNTHQ